MARKVWVYGRLLVPVAVVLAGLTGGLAVWVASGQAEQSPALDTSVPDEVRRLRSELRDPAAARALAEQFLATYADSDLLSQLVHYEYAATFYSDGRHDEALAQFAALLDEYETIVTDVTSPYCRLDDAEFLSGVIHTGAGRLAEARACYMRIYEEMPGSSRQAGALQFLTRLLIEEEHASRQAGAPQMVVDHADAVAANVAILVAEHAGDPACAGALLDLLNYHTRRFQLGAETAGELRAVTDTAVTALRTVAPTSPETMRAILSLAELTLPHDPTAAVSLADEGLRLANVLGHVPALVDAHLVRARILEGVGRGMEAYEGLMLAYGLVGDDPRAVTMLVEANRRLRQMEALSERWEATEDVDHSATLDANVAQLLLRRPEDAACLEAMHDLVRFAADRVRHRPNERLRALQRATAMLAKMRQLDPDAPLTLRAELAVAEIVATERAEEALGLVATLLARAADANDRPLALDLRFLEAHLLYEAGRLPQAAAAYTAIYESEAPGPRTIDALRRANVALINEEIADWAPKPRARQTDHDRSIDNTATIEANVARLLAEHPAHAPRLLFDLQDYYYNRAQFNEATETPSRDRVLECADQIQRLAPGSREAFQAGCVAVKVLLRRDMAAAEALVAKLATDAELLGDAQLRMDAKLIRARLLAAQGDNDTAVAIIAGVLADDVPLLSPALKYCLMGELALEMAKIRGRQGRIDEALAICAAAQHDSDLQVDMRAMLAVRKGLLHERQAQPGAAAQAYQEAIQLYPGTITAETAERLLARLSEARPS